MSIDDVARLIASPAIEYRPELRWWLAEGLHTDETLRHEIETAYRLGFGQRKAGVGPQDVRIGTTRVWHLPNPSGLNAHYSQAALSAAFSELSGALGDEAAA